MAKQKKVKKTDLVGKTRLTWEMSPVTRVVKSKKRYDRQRDRKQAVRNEMF